MWKLFYRDSGYKLSNINVMFNLLEQKHNGSSAITILSENPYKIPWGGGGFS